MGGGEEQGGFFQSEPFLPIREIRDSRFLVFEVQLNNILGTSKRGRKRKGRLPRLSSLVPITLVYGSRASIAGWD